MDDRLKVLEKYNFWSGNTPSLGFIRTDYTGKIYAYKGNRLVKVLVGQRRVGKSYVLRQLAYRLIEDGVDEYEI